MPSPCASRHEKCKVSARFGRERPSRFFHPAAEGDSTRRHSTQRFAVKLTRVGGTTLIRSVAGFCRINLVTPDINQCRVNAVPVVDLSRWYICYRKRCVSPPFRERERDLHGTFHPGRCGVINHRTRPKSCATAEACVVLRTEFADIRLRVFKLHRHFHDFFCVTACAATGSSATVP